MTAMGFSLRTWVKSVCWQPALLYVAVLVNLADGLGAPIWEVDPVLEHGHGEDVRRLGLVDDGDLPEDEIGAGNVIVLGIDQQRIGAPVAGGRTTPEVTSILQHHHNVRGLCAQYTARSATNPRSGAGSAAERSPCPGGAQSWYQWRCHRPGR